MKLTVQDALMWTKPHICVGPLRMRIILKMYEGRWVVGTLTTHMPSEVEALGLLMHPFFHAAVRFMDEANARLAKQRASEALEKVMNL